jgi:SAM-dependent methyltransferase
MLEKEFTHYAGYPDYMEMVERIVTRMGKPTDRLLDMPAGNGMFADKLRGHGFVVTCGDINRERTDYVYTNMEQPLPFSDGAFDFVTCMEGIEHVINPASLVSELARIVKPGGHVIITMPNVQNYYSRLKFLFTGFFYQFDSDFLRHPRGKLIDRGHVSSLSYQQLNYIFSEFHLEPVLIDGDRFKKKLLMPVYLLIAAFNLAWYAKKARQPGDPTPYRMLINSKFLFSRSLIAVWKKTPA